MSSGIDVLGAYHLLRPIGRGGMASVWLAIDARNGRPVAVKRMRRDVAGDREMARAFADEATLGLRLRHPNIVEAIERGEAIDALGVEHYLVLELLRGRTAGEILRESTGQGQPIPLGVALGIVRDVARGLDHAHRLVDADGTPLGIVHRDVNPRNVFVCEDGIAKIIDFGIAKANRQTHETDHGTIRGTLGYLAPEQIRGHEADARVDVFALGLIAYELLTGIQPLRGDNDADTLFRLLEQPVASPEEVRPEVPAAIGAIVMRALKRDRDRRLPSAGALADTIEASAAHEGISIDRGVTQAHLLSTFPDDERTQTSHLAAAERLYVHLRANATPKLQPMGQPTVPMPTWRGGRRSRPVVRAALALGALSLAALAAASTAHLLGRGSAPTPVPPVQAVVAPILAPAMVVPERAVGEPVSPERIEKIPEIAAPKLPAAPHPKLAKHGVRSDCVVYISLTKGPTTVCGDRKKPGAMKSKRHGR